MFSKGEMVVYGHTGVCTVEDVCEKEFSNRKTRLYYTLRPVYQQNNVIYAPVDSEHVFIRSIVSRPQAERLVERIPELCEKAAAEFESGEGKTAPLSDCRSCTELAENAIRIHNRKIRLGKIKKKLGFSEEKQLKVTEELLFGELAVVFKVPPEQIPDMLFGEIK